MYIFHRHGDRTAKSTPPTNLTDLGYQEVATAGTYFRDRYVSSSATNKIAGLNTNQVKLGQLSITAPVDNVLMSSAVGFSQALYPAVPNSAETLRNGSVIQAPMNGYQIIPIGTVSTGGGSEDSGWLQDATDCGAAESSSNAYFSSPEYMTLANATAPFYSRLQPVVNATFSANSTSYKNAYTIFDLINVAEIHNASIPASNLLDDPTLFQLRTLADAHELNLAWNASSPIRGIAGMQLAAQVVDFFNTSTAKSSAPKLGVQFGAYGTFQSYFGLADLLNLPGAPGSTDDFNGIPDYASAMVWELYTDSNGPVTYPVDPSSLNVRFLFHNGTSSNISAPSVYPLFNSTGPSMRFSDFEQATGKFSVGNTQQWCQLCGNSTGTCAQYAGNTGSSGNGGVVQSSGSGGSHLSNAVAGVIGAMVTLGVILLVEVAVLLVGGLRLVSKKRLAGPAAAGNGVVNGSNGKA